MGENWTGEESAADTWGGGDTAVADGAEEHLKEVVLHIPASSMGRANQSSVRTHWSLSCSRAWHRKYSLRSLLTCLVFGMVESPGGTHP